MEVLILAFKLNYKNSLTYLTIPSFEETGIVKHGFSTRLGGSSQGPYESLNLGFKKNDDKFHVLNNYKLFCEALNIDIKNLVASDQIHGNEVYTAKACDRGKGIVRDSNIKGKDAIITKDNNVGLLTYYADCVPIFFLDIKTPAVGLAHAGWRGTVHKIAQKTLSKMMKEFGTLPKDILIGIGPCINRCCYEVDKPVVNEFKNSFANWQDLLEYKGDWKWMLNLELANKSLLEQMGIHPSQITVSGFCTSCNNDLFFSYRKDQGETGSLAAVIELI